MVLQKGKIEVPEVDLGSYAIDEKITRLVPASIAEKYKLLPLFKVGRNLTVAMADPRNIVAVDEVRTAAKMDVTVVKSSVEDIMEAISQYYGISAIVEDVVKNYKQPEVEDKPRVGVSEDAPIVRLVNVIIEQAIAEKASDIHVEPESGDVRIRYRVDGILHQEIELPSVMLAPVISRIKVLAGLDIAESRRPQDGRFEFNVTGRPVDLRVSTFPTAFGEKIVMRILDKTAMTLRLSEIGFSKDNYAKFKEIIHKPHGIVLVTGPTGSGKTTTLYATLLELSRKELNVMTVEDPIEYYLDGIMQSQVNVQAGLVFSVALRSILRQDPDIILIGEVRDLDTANIAVQAAMTGHLVLSTLHTNDAAGSIARLLDMKIEPFLIASSLEAVLAQRLVRSLCQKCKKAVPVPPALQSKYPDLKELYKGEGCKACKNSGYKGRIGIFELMVVDDEIRKLIMAGTSADQIKKQAVAGGMKTLFVDGMEKVLSGLTTIDEVLRGTEID